MGTDMHTPRLDLKAVSPAFYAHMIGFRRLLEESGLDAGLREIIKVRASQINGCAFCLDMHVQEARRLGVADDRLHLLSVWRDVPGFTPPERAALALTEAVTRLADSGVPDTLYGEVRRYFTAEQYVGLLATIAAINAWNRLMVGTGAVVPPR